MGSHFTLCAIETQSQRQGNGNPQLLCGHLSKTCNKAINSILIASILSEQSCDSRMADERHPPTLLVMGWQQKYLFGSKQQCAVL